MDRRTVAITAGIVLLAFAFLVSMPFWAAQAIVFLAGLILLEAVFALSWNLMFGFTGVTTFGHAAFFAIGGYLVAVGLKMQWPVPFLGLLLGAAVLGGLVSLLVGFIALTRAAGIAFAIFTMALGEILKILIGYSDALGREDGIAGVKRPVLELGFTQISLQSTFSYFWFLCIVCVLIGLGLWWISYNSFGRVLRSIQQDHERTAFLGINVARYRLVSFAIAGGVAALAGGLYAPWVQTITPELADAFRSAQPMLNSLLGGAHHFLGPVVGTVLFAFVNYSTRTLVGLSELVVGGVLLIIILAAPSGVLGLVDDAVARLRRGGRK
jgi:branched-chain amino acid transport system permease protein